MKEKPIKSQILDSIAKELGVDIAMIAPLLDCVPNKKLILLRDLLRDVRKRPTPRQGLEP